VSFWGGIVDSFDDVLCLQCVSGLISLLYLATAEQLRSSLLDVPFSSFVKSLLRESDPDAAASGVIFSQLLLDKLPDAFVPAYAKEGTYAALKRLAPLAPPAPKPALQVCSTGFSEAISMSLKICSRAVSILRVARHLLRIVP
jgi:hypothetical protein